MYNSTNLPLSKKKIIKKSFGSILFFALSQIILVAVIILSISLGNFSRSLPVIILIWLVLLLISLPQVIYQYLYYKYYYYNFQEDEAEIRKGVVSRATGHVQYRKIQNIFLDQDVLDRIFGLYDVHYETAGLTSGFYSHVDGLNRENADKLVTFLKEYTRNSENKTLPVREAVDRMEPVATTTDTPDDGTRYSRGNLPIEKKMIWATLLPSFITLPIASFFVLAWISNAMNINWESLPSALIIFICFLFFVMPMVFNFIYWIIWYKNFKFTFEKDGGEVTSKVISVHQTHLYFDRIQNVNVSQSFIQRLFGLYVVSIETAAEGSALFSLVIPGLNQKNAETLKDYLLTKAKKHREI